MRNSSFINNIKSILTLLGLHPNSTDVLSKSHKTLNLESNNFEFNINIKSQISDSILKKYYSADSKQVFSLLVKDIQLSNTQKKLYYLFNSKYYYKSILTAHYYNTKVIYPLDISWKRIFEMNNVSVNWLLSNTLWKILDAFSISKSFIRVSINIFTDKYLKRATYILNKKENVYFYDFPRTGDSNISIKSKELNFHSWYFYTYMNCENSLKDADDWVTKDIYNRKNTDLSEGVRINNGSLSGEIGLFGELEILFEVIREFIRKALARDFKTCNLILQNLQELITYKRIIDGGNKILVSRVIFNASLAYHKPIWVNALEYLGIDVDYFFYSVYSQPTLNDEQNSFRDGWQLCNWKKIFVIDQKQKNDLQGVIELDAAIEIMPSIPNLSCLWQDPKALGANYVVFFDNNIISETFHFGTLASIGYDEVRFQIDYLKSIMETVIESDMILVYKYKRPNSQKLPLQFKQFLEEAKIKHLNDFIIVESDVSPQTLIKNATAVICKPLSTTALIAKQNSSLVAYFDPTCKIKKSDPNLREIDTLNSVDELKKFILKGKN
jgi:polysaccharide biosynthesis PFTS motif protein